MDSAYVSQIGGANRLDVWLQEKTEVKRVSKAFDLNDWVRSVATY